MAQPAFEELVETFEFLDDWEDRYRHVIDMGKSLDPMEDALKVPATKVDGCASQVWLHITEDAGKISFQGDSDAIIVKGLIGVLQALFVGTTRAEAQAIDAMAEMKRLGLDGHLSAQRSNGLRAMIARLQSGG